MDRICQSGLSWEVLELLEEGQHSTHLMCAHEPRLWSSCFGTCIGQYQVRDMNEYSLNIQCSSVFIQLSETAWVLYYLHKVWVPNSSAIIPSRPRHPFRGTEMSRPKWWRPKFIRLILLQNLVGQIPLDFRAVLKAQVAFILLFFYFFITHGDPTHPTNYHVNQQKWPSQLGPPSCLMGNCGKGPGCWRKIPHHWSIECWFERA